MKENLLVVVILLSSVTGAFADTDYQCFNACTISGYNYTACLARCSTPNGYNAPPTHVLTPMDVFPTARERIGIDQQAQDNLRRQEELKAARLRNRLLQLQVEEAERRARESKQDKAPEKADE